MCLFCYCASFLVSHQVGDPGCWPESLQLHPSSISRRLASAGCQIVTSHSFLVPDEDLACRHPPSGRRIVFWIILSFLNCLLELSLTLVVSPLVSPSRGAWTCFWYASQPRRVRLHMTVVLSSRYSSVGAFLVKLSFDPLREHFLLLIWHINV